MIYDMIYDYDMIRYDTIWYMICDMIYDIYIIWYDIYDMIRYDTIRYDTIRYDMIYDMTWYDMIWYVMIWYDMISGNRPKNSIVRWSSWCCRSAWKFCYNAKTALRLNTTLNRHTLDVLSIKCVTKNVSKNGKFQYQLCYLFNTRKWKPLLQISPVLPLEIKPILTFAYRGSDPGGGGGRHIIFLYTTLT
jgi:hypothetical protein